MDDVRRPQILSAAAQLLSEERLSSVRVADVAWRPGTSATTVIYYFGTKDELFEEATADADDAFDDALLADIERLDGGVDRIARLIVSSSSSSNSSSSANACLLWLDLWIHARRHPEFLKVQRRFDRRFRDMIAVAIRHKQNRDELDPIDADEVELRRNTTLGRPILDIPNPCYTYMTNARPRDAMRITGGLKSNWCAC